MKSKFLKASQVAGRYGVTSVSVKRWVKAGYFPNAKLEETIAGSVWLIPETDLENFVKPTIGRPLKETINKK